MPSPPLELPLSRVQKWMQTVIEHPGTVEEAVGAPPARVELDPRQIERVVLPSKTLTSVERVGVYQGMYLLRMVEALASDYPAVAHWMGEERFEKLVSRYVQAHPSVHYSLNRLGDHLPEFIRRSKGVRKKEFLGDLARLELAVTEVFDAPQSPAWPAEEVARIPEAAWEMAVMKPIEAFRLAAFGYPVNAYLQSVKEDRHDYPEIRRKPSWVAIYRKDYEVWRLDLTKPAYEFLRALSRGRPFGKAVAEAAGRLQGAAGDRLFRWLRDWVAEGIFQGIDASTSR
ncbi:MAG TPA: DNA-binding domain-containing protein [Thermoanaerobaculia bacterium]